MKKILSLIFVLILAICFCSSCVRYSDEYVVSNYDQNEKKIMSFLDVDDETAEHIRENVDSYMDWEDYYIDKKEDSEEDGVYILRCNHNQDRSENKENLYFVYLDEEYNVIRCSQGATLEKGGEEI